MEDRTNKHIKVTPRIKILEQHWQKGHNYLFEIFSIDDKIYKIQSYSRRNPNVSGDEIETLTELGWKKVATSTELGVKPKNKKFLKEVNKTESDYRGNRINQEKRAEKLKRASKTHKEKKIMKKYNEKIRLKMTEVFHCEQ